MLGHLLVDVGGGRLAGVLAGARVAVLTLLDGLTANGLEEKKVLNKSSIIFVNWLT